MTTPLPHTPQPRPMRPPQDDIDLMKYLYMFLANWYWFALAFVLSMGITYILNRYSAKVYTQIGFSGPEIFFHRGAKKPR